MPRRPGCLHRTCKNALCQDCHLADTFAWQVCLPGCLPAGLSGFPVCWPARSHVCSLLAKATLTQASAEDHPVAVDTTLCTPPRDTLLGGGGMAAPRPPWCNAVRLRWCKTVMQTACLNQRCKQHYRHTLQSRPGARWQGSNGLLRFSKKQSSHKNLPTCSCEERWCITPGTHKSSAEDRGHTF